MNGCHVTSFQYRSGGRWLWGCRCTCGASVIGMTTAGMTAGWEADHRGTGVVLHPSFQPTSGGAA